MKRKILKIEGKNKNLNILSIHKTNSHIYIQIFSHDKKKVLVSSSTTEKKILNNITLKGKNTKSFYAAKLISKFILIKAKNKNINKTIFFNKYKYQGKIKFIACYLKKNFLI
ncbi:50S ribosomal protein L18 [Candidatus Vidania fulgoroideorum]